MNKCRIGTGTKVDVEFERHTGNLDIHFSPDLTNSTKDTKSQ